jgi:hypothetical protein
MHKYFKKCNYKGKEMLETALAVQNVSPYIEGGTLFWGLIAVIVIMLAIFDSFYRNLKGETSIITDWSGGVVKIMSGDGQYFKKPFIEYREVITGGVPEMVSLGNVSAITKDYHGISYPNLNIFLYKIYSKTKTNIPGLIEESKSNSLNDGIINLVISGIEEIVSKYDSNEINKKQLEIEKELVSLLNKELRKDKFLIIRVVPTGGCVHTGKK